MTEKRPILLTLLIYAIAAALIALAIGPAIWLLGIALQNKNVPLSRLPAPSEMTDGNFKGAFGLKQDQSWSDGISQLWNQRNPDGSRLFWTDTLVRPLLNSVVITVIQATLNVTLAALAAFPLARMRFRGRDTLFVIILATLMIPEQVIVVPMFRTIVSMGLYDTLAAVILPFSVSAFGIYLVRQSFMGIPKELEEAAALDGASSFQVWRQVMLPLSAPTLATLAVFSVIGAWSALLWPLVVLQDEKNYTLPVALNQLLSVFSTNIRFAYAGAVLALIPMVIVYIVMQKWLAKGLLAGAVKG